MVERARALLLTSLALLAPAAAQRSAERHAPSELPRERVVEDVQYAEGFAKEPRRNRLDLYLPDAANAPVVMFVHGGMWTGGRKDSWGGLARGFVRAGIACAVVNTQLFPFATPAEMAADCGRALGWLHRNAGEHGYDGDRLFLMGHSSGGHLVSLLGLDGARLDAAGVPRAALRGILGLSGVYEVRTRHLALDKVFGGDAGVRADASPFVHASADDPPMLLLWGERDIPGLPLVGRQLGQRLRELGVPVAGGELPGAGHADYVRALGRPEDTLLPRLAAFVHAPPVAGAMPPPPAAASRRVALDPGGDLPAAVAIVPSEAPARRLLLWLAPAEAERRHAEALAAALAPRGIAVVIAPGAWTAATAAAAFRGLHARAPALGLPAPEFLGGTAEAGLAAALAPLGLADGLRARVLAGTALGARSLADAAAGARAPDVLAHLKAPATRSAVLLLQAEHDPEPLRADGVALGLALHAAGVDVDLVEVPGVTTAAALAAAGAPGELLPPLLRAFLDR